MTNQELKSAERALGLSFRTKRLLKLALTHRSYANDHSDTDLSNERLEFFGDTVLSFVISKHFYLNFPEIKEGVMSRYRSLIVSRKSLFKIAKQLKLHQHLLLGKSEKSLLLKDKARILSDCFEAIIGAVYLDRGMKAAEAFILKCFLVQLKPVNLKRLDTHENDKNRLQELFQKYFKKLPKYESKQSGTDFSVTIRLKKKIIGKGTGPSKRVAEKKAAKEALRALKRMI